MIPSIDPYKGAPDVKFSLVPCSKALYMAGNPLITSSESSILAGDLEISGFFGDPAASWVVFPEAVL